MVMVYVPAGEFLMGSLDTDTQADDDEKPQHSVYLDAFRIDQYEVTNMQYAKCVDSGACDPHTRIQYIHSQYDDHPVTFVTWDAANTYCEWARR